ncbi:Cytochrome P450 82A3 [Euphorbia peplus]|nr:Cytochrome P450 82A3 [Euphorbia peplus]
MDLFSNIIAILGMVALILLLKLRKRGKYRKSTGKRVPEVVGGLPIIGHMHLLSEKKSLGRIFGNLADKYGPIFSVRLGAHRAIFVSDYKAVKECFTINDIAMSSRPSSTQSKLVGYNGATFGFAPYGPFWRNMRKFTAVKLLCSSRVRMLSYIPESELNYLINDLYNRCSNNNVKIDMDECINRLTVNVITRMVAGKRVFDGNNDVGGVNARSLSKIVRELLDVAGQVVPGDVIPFMGWLDIKGVVKKMKIVSDEIGSIVDGWIQEHKINNNKTEEQKDLIDVMLSEITDDEEMGFDKDTIIKGTSTAMIIGASDTTAISLIWLLSNLLNNKRTLERCQEELDLKVGRNRWVQVEDVEKLDYLHAVIKESFRLNSPGPIAVPKDVTEDCYVSGYFIPKGTRLFINVWKLHRDPNIWSNPDEFVPERFLNEKSHVGVTGNNFEFLPFSAGRRNCPGIILAMHVLNLTIARLVQGFNFSTPNNEPVDMIEGQHIIMRKEKPLEVVLTPRLDPRLYDQE